MKFCKDCAHYVAVKGGACAKGFFRVSVEYARAPGHACGPQASWFEPKAVTSERSV